MSVAAEDFKRIAIANLKEEADVMGWDKQSVEYKDKFRAILAQANEMVGAAAAPAEAAAFKEPKRVDPPWENKWKDYMCKDFKAMFGQLQELQKGTWTKDKMHDSSRTDGSKTKRWVSPDGETLVRVTQRVAPKDEDSMGMYELCTCPSNYRVAYLAKKEAEEQAKADKKAQAKAKKEAKEARKAAKEAKKAAQEALEEAPAEEDPSQQEPSQEADAEKGRARRSRTRGGEARAAGSTLTGTLLRAKNEAAAKALIMGKGREIKTKGQLAAEKAAALKAAAAAAQAPAAATPTATPTATPEDAPAPAKKLTKKEKEQLAKLAKKGAGDKKGAGAQGDNKKPKEKAAGGDKPAGSGKRKSVEVEDEPLARTRSRRHETGKQ